MDDWTLLIVASLGTGLVMGWYALVFRYMAKTSFVKLADQKQMIQCETFRIRKDRGIYVEFSKLNCQRSYDGTRLEAMTIPVSFGRMVYIDLADSGIRMGVTINGAMFVSDDGRVTGLVCSGEHKHTFYGEGWTYCGSVWPV